MGLFDAIASNINSTMAVGTALYQGWNANKMQDKANQANVELMRENNAFNERMMNQQNEYNSYQSQVQRALDAGLNPAYLFGEGASSPAVAPATASAAPEIKPTSFGNSFIEALYKATELGARIKKNEAEIDNINAETTSVKTANEVLKERLDAEIDNIRSNTSYNEAKKKEAEQNCKVAAAHEQELYKNIEAISQSIHLTKANVKHVLNQIELDNKRVDAEVNRWAHQNRLDDATILVTRRSIIKLNNEIALQIKQGKQMDAAWLSQALDNAVKQVAAEADIRDYNLRLQDPAYDYLVRYMKGELGNLAHALNGSITSIRDNATAQKKAKEQLDAHIRASYLYK